MIFIILYNFTNHHLALNFYTLIHKATYMNNLSVQEVMSTGLITAHKDENLTKIANIFKENTFHHIPVVDDDECLVGMISRTDFDKIKSGGSLFRNPKKEEYDEALFISMLAVDIMTKDVKKLQPTDSVQKAYVIFKENKFRALPIVAKGKLVGIVTPLDMLEYFFNAG